MEVSENVEAAIQISIMDVSENVEAATEIPNVEDPEGYNHKPDPGGRGGGDGRGAFRDRGRTPGGGTRDRRR